MANTSGNDTPIDTDAGSSGNPGASADEELGGRGDAGGASDGREESRRRRFEQVIPDLVRRTLYAGLGALFTTEEGIRKIATDLKLPKDVANYLIQQAGASKDEVLRVVGRELRGFLETVNISGELQKLLTSLSFEVKTEVRFIPNDEAIGGVKPDLKVGRMSLKRNREEKAGKGERSGGGDEPM